MSDEWEIAGYRVEWLESPAFAGGKPTPHHVVVLTRSGVLRVLRDVSKRRPVTERPLHSPRVVELQQRIETRERPCGLVGWWS